MIEAPIRRLLATARRYRAAFYALQAARDASDARGDEATSERLRAAQAELDAARRALNAAALASDDATVLLPGIDEEAGVTSGEP